MAAQGSQQAESLLQRLKDDLKQKKLDDKERQKLLEELKVLGRNPANAQPIFARDGFHTLLQYAFDNGSNAASKEAMRCAANAMLLNEPTRQLLLDLQYDGKAADRLKIDDRDEEFLASRLLFYTTYTAKLDITRLLDEHELAESISANLRRHYTRLSNVSEKDVSKPMDQMAMDETLKLIPNLVYFSRDAAIKLCPAVEPISSILTTIDLPSPPLEPPIKSLVNALMNLELDPANTTAKISDAEKEADKPQINNDKDLTARLLHILDLSSTAYPEKALDEILSPLLHLLRKVYTSSTTSSEAKQQMRSTILPDTSTRDEPLGKDSSLPSRLLRLSVSPYHPLLRDSIAELIYDLSDRDAVTLVDNIGYGYAAGYLASNGIAAPPAISSSTGETATGHINPVTGQRFDAEAESQLPPMTDEEKEREAERLFVLFERLKATGVVDVQNPVEQAMREGRFEDVD